jgi:sugar phosphate isomerase/epimerase
MSIQLAENPLAFSTLGCPEWTIEAVVAKAAQFGYDGIEWRGGPEGHLSPALSPQQRIELNSRMRDADIASLAISTYTSFVSDDRAARQTNLDDLRRYVDLAADLACDFVRVFLGELEPGVKTQDVEDRVVAGLEAALKHAKARGVGIAIEPHDDFVRPQTVAPILERVPDPNLGVVWDIGNTFAFGEPVTKGFQLLGKRIFYVHLKDSIGQWPNRQLMLLGAGEVPLQLGIQLLMEADYPGPFSYEWERAWYPELPAAEVAFPIALQAMRTLLIEAQAAAARQRHGGTA